MWNKVTSPKLSRASIGLCLVVAVLALPFAIKTQRAQGTQGTATQSAAPQDSDVRPPVAQADLQIAKRAREILDSPTKWNRADNRQCPAGAKTISLYCALQIATNEVSGKSEHRGAALQEARFVIDEIVVNRDYNHRLMDYNNDPTTTFADIQEVLRITESLIALRLKAEAANAGKAAVQPASTQAKPDVAKADVEIIKRVRRILDTPAKWDRHGTQTCQADAQVLGLYCALVKATTEINGVADKKGTAFQEARRAIEETAPNHQNYQALLVDFNNDPTVTFADLQKLLQLVEERLTKRLAENSGK